MEISQEKKKSQAKMGNKYANKYPSNSIPQESQGLVSA